MSIKDKVYEWAVRKNKDVQYEYERYVMEHTVEHYENRGKHWKILWKLNWHYRICRKNSPMLYFDAPTPKGEEKTVKAPVASTSPKAVQKPPVSNQPPVQNKKESSREEYSIYCGFRFH